MGLPKMKTLVNVAMGIAGIGITGMMYAQVKQLEQISNSAFFKEAFQILRTHKGKHASNRFQFINESST